MMKVTIEPEMNEESEEKEYDEYEVKCAVDTLIKAEEIKKDAKLFALVMEKLNNKKEAITSIAALRKVAAKKSAEE